MSRIIILILGVRIICVSDLILLSFGVKMLKNIDVKMYLFYQCNLLFRRFSYRIHLFCFLLVWDYIRRTYHLGNCKIGSVAK